MSTGQGADQQADIELFPRGARSKSVSDDLAELRRALIEACPHEAVIAFEYDGTLHVHIDVRKVEHITQIEAILPSLCGGIFLRPQRRMSANHSFFHRLSATVER